MGALSGLGQGIATGFGGAQNPAALAQTSMGYGAAGTLLGTAAPIFQSISTIQQANYSATIDRLNAQAANAAGDQAVEASKIKYGTLVSQQRADAAGNGVGVNSENVQNIQRGTRAFGALDAAILHYNAQREAYGALSAETQEKSVAANAPFAALYGAGANFLGNASSLSSRWAQFQASGAPSNSISLGGM